MTRLGLAVAAALSCVGCRDLSGFSTSGGSFVGEVVGGPYWSAGVADKTQLCLTLDADHFQDGPGLVSTSDGRFHSVALRPIPELWRDPLSTLSFGQGRLKNFIYVVSASTPFADGNGNDAFVVVSLMQSGGVEVRLLRGAPPLADDEASTEEGATATNLFAVFVLSRQKSPCSF